MESENLPLDDRVVYPLCTTDKDDEALRAELGIHCRVYNKFLEMHKERDERGKVFLPWKDMLDVLEQWKKNDVALLSVNPRSLEATVSRVFEVLTYYWARKQEFIAHKKAVQEKAAQEGRKATKAEIGKEPGFPRFKSIKRFSGWGYPAYCDGWKLLPTEKNPKQVGLNLFSKHHDLAIEGDAQLPGEPLMAEIQHKQNKWFIAIFCK
jgi:putative transposase